VQLRVPFAPGDGLTITHRARLHPTRCKKIGGGRVAALEVLLATPAISSLIREGKALTLTG
jgi:Tfp pilus assembly pilus retraction ATPase PilT